MLVICLSMFELDDIRLATHLQLVTRILKIVQIFMAVFMGTHKWPKVLCLMKKRKCEFTIISGFFG